jgi:hypothetical protein
MSRRTNRTRRSITTVALMASLVVWSADQAFAADAQVDRAGAAVALTSVATPSTTDGARPMLLIHSGTGPMITSDEILAHVRRLGLSSYRDADAVGVQAAAVGDSSHGCGLSVLALAAGAGMIIGSLIADSRATTVFTYHGADIYFAGAGAIAMTTGAVMMKHHCGH